MYSSLKMIILGYYNISWLLGFPLLWETNIKKPQVSQFFQVLRQHGLSFNVDNSTAVEGEMFSSLTLLQGSRGI